MKTDWSKVGKKSRRKGKAFECELARLFRKISGDNWQTSRNSGRTDTRGDIYCADYPNVMVECKHRKSLTLKSMLNGTKIYTDTIDYITKDFLKYEHLDTLLIVMKTEHGIWVGSAVRCGKSKNVLLWMNDCNPSPDENYLSIKGVPWLWLDKEEDAIKGFMKWLQTRI